MELAVEDIEEDLDKGELMNLPNEQIFDLSSTELVQVQNFKDDFQTRGFFKKAGGNQESVEILNQSTNKCDKSH